MHGNVCEWCGDWYGAYAKGAKRDPEGAAKGDGRVVRGGSWYFQPRFCGSAFRDWFSSDDRYYFGGLRVVVPASPKMP